MLWIYSTAQLHRLCCIFIVWYQRITSYFARLICATCPQAVETTRCRFICQLPGAKTLSNTEIRERGISEIISQNCPNQILFLLQYSRLIIPCRSGAARVEPSEPLRRGQSGPGHRLLRGAHLHVPGHEHRSRPVHVVYRGRQNMLSIFYHRLYTWMDD